MEWKKMRFMEDRVGEDFGGIILSCTKYGFFVELDDLFIEGLVPLASLSTWGSDERFVFRDTDKQIVSTRTGRAFKMGQRVHVLLDRIDRQQRRLQFATWYPEKAETGKVVPTWNYAVVHVYGRLSIHDGPDWLRPHLEALTNVHEAGTAAPWKVADAPDDFVSAMMKGIVGLEIAITRLAGKWKASQNRPEKDRLAVAEGLGELETESSRAMKGLVERRG
jgi:hypothetical protein